MDSNHKTMAIAYDFDGTLAPGFMQEHSFFPELGLNPKEDFWPYVSEFAKEHDMDEILAYMNLMLHEATHKRISIKKNAFIKHGEGLQFFLGVEYWFKRINDYAKDKGVEIKHYIVSSGLREMIQGTSIANEFDYIFASGFVYNRDGVAIWPALSVNYTNKTQYLFRINKGINNSWDSKSINKFTPADERPIPFENIIYIGDGETDVPAMKMTRHNNGTAIAVFDTDNPKSKESADALITQDRADYSVQADYREGTDLDKTIKTLIDKIAKKV